MSAALKSFTIVDELSIQETGAVEVTVELRDSRRRRCNFIIPSALSRCGDWLDGSRIPSHYGAAHMIVVSAQPDGIIIGKVLRQIDQNGDLERCTLPLEH